jgi:hypothetical protein
MRTRLCICALVLLLMALLGCSSDEDSGGPSSPGRAFSTDALPTGAALYLRQRELGSG